MFRKILRLMFLVIALGTLAGGQIHAQNTNNLTFALSRADTMPPNEDPEQKTIEVAFGKSLPSIEALENVDNWLVRSLSENGVETSFKPASATFFRADPTQNIVHLKMAQTYSPGGPLDPATHRVTIRFQQANFPDVDLNKLQTQGTSPIFVPAKGKADADIYLSGLAAAARGAKPLYSFESKLGYLWSLGRKGAIGARGTVDAAKETNIDPDSITFMGSYEKVFVFAPVTGMIFRSDFIGGEIDKANETHNLATKADAVFVIPSAQLGESNFATIDFTFGFEGGKNYRHELDPDGLGGFWRWKLGATAYFVALNPPAFSRINFSTEYKVRLLNSAEPFTEKIGGEDITRLRKKPRHYVGSDLDFMFSKAFGISIKYRYGSLPPAFKFVDHSVSAGLTFQLKQANK